MQTVSGASGPLGWIYWEVWGVHVWLAPGRRAVGSEVGGKPQRAEQVSLFREEMQNGQLDRGGPGEQRQLETLVASVGPLQKPCPASLPWSAYGTL